MVEINMNIEETDYVEIVERCNLKTGVNTVFSGGEVLSTTTLSVDKIYEKYKDYLTKDQIRNLYRKTYVYETPCIRYESNPVINDEVPQSLIDVIQLLGEKFFDLDGKLFENGLKLKYVDPLSHETLSNINNYYYGIDPYKFDSTGCKVEVFKNESRH